MKGALDYRSMKLEEALAPEVRDALRSAARIQHFNDGEMIYSEGDNAEDLLIIYAGSVRVGRVTTDGREMTTAVLGSGHLLGLVGMMVGKRVQSATANGETTVGRVARSEVDRLLGTHPDLAVQLLPVLASRLQAAYDFIHDVKRLPGSVHTAAILEQMLDASPEPNVIDWSQSDIALAVGNSRVSVGKALKELERLGLIELKYARVEVPDPQRLTEWVTEQRNNLLHGA